MIRPSSLVAVLGLTALLTSCGPASQPEPPAGPPSTESGDGLAPSDPGSGDPGSGDPGSGDPGSGDPGSGDPGSGDPGSDDPPPVGGTLGTEDCPALTVAPGDLGGFSVDAVSWADAGCRPRSADLVRNTEQDPKGLWGGYVHRFVYEVDGAPRVCASSSDRHPGFGIVTSHYPGTAALSHRQRGLSTETLLAGPHHAIHAFRWRYPIDGHPVTITVHWFFATGRDHPVYAITYDLNEAPADAVMADTRAPYGEVDWDGGLDVEVDGLGWGDRHRFVTLDSPVTLDSGWDYTAPNEIPHVREWSKRADAEMGLVQTQSWRRQDAGGMDFWRSWGTRNEAGPLPKQGQWPFQLNQYEMPFTTRSKRLAWGSNYGAVGQRSYPVFGNDGQASGWPFQSYSVYVVLGTHSDDPVLEQAGRVEAEEAAVLEATVGEVLQEGPAGVGRTDTAPYAPAGYDPVYGTWRIRAEAGVVDATLTPGGAALENPMLVVHDWPGERAPAAVRIGDRRLVPDEGYHATVDAASGQLWLTLRGSFSGASRVRVEAQ